MDYKQITQSSELYKYGRNEKFETKDEAEKAIEKLKQEIGTQLSSLKLYQLSEMKIIEIENALQLVVRIKIPQLFNKNWSNIKNDRTNLSFFVCVNM